MMFPSPCGDKLFRREYMGGRCQGLCYRPLAGISCFLTLAKKEGFHMKMLPSPSGDKLFLLATSLYHNNLKLPSPCGDKLFREGSMDDACIDPDVTVPLRG